MISLSEIRTGSEEVDWLSYRIRRLASPHRSHAKTALQLTGTTGEDLLMALLNELDETVLPRRYELTNNLGVSIILHVKQRQLFWPFQAGKHCQNTVAYAIHHLLAFFQDAQVASITGSRWEPDAISAEPGVALSALIATACSQSCSPPSPGIGPSRFSVLTPHFTAYVKIDRSFNIAYKEGDPALVARLETLVLNGLEDIDIQLGHSLQVPDHVGYLSLASDSTNGQALIYVRGREYGILALMKSGQLPDLRSAWLTFQREKPEPMPHFASAIF